MVYSRVLQQLTMQAGEQTFGVQGQSTTVHQGETGRERAGKMKGEK
jgi:hypothetical protein